MVFKISNASRNGRLVKDKNSRNKNILDESDKEGLRVTIELKRCQPQKILNQLLNQLL